MDQNLKKPPGRLRDRLLHPFSSRNRTPSQNTTPPTTTASSTVDADDNDSAAITLWDIAYDNLQQSESGLIEDYEKRLSEQVVVDKDTSSKDAVQFQEHSSPINRKTRRDKMNHILEAGFAMTAKSDFAFREKTNDVVAVVTTFKSLVDEAVKVSPEASLAWAGVSFFLPMLTNLHTEKESFKETFSYVISRAPVYAKLDNELRDETTVSASSSSSVSERLRLAFIELYTTVITFQAKAVMRVFSNKGSMIVRDAVGWDGWEALGTTVKGAESALMEAIRGRQSEISTKKLEEIAQSGQHNRCLLKDSLDSLEEAVDRLNDLIVIEKEQLNHMDRDEEYQKQILESNRGQMEFLKDQKNKDCISDLRITDPRDDKKRIVYDKGGLLNDCYQWIFENPIFQKWRDNKDNRLLWVEGSPGKGKTMLLCGIIDELNKSMAMPVEVSYFFCQATEEQINGAMAVLRGLIYSLVIQQPSLVSHIRKKHDYAGKRLFEDSNAWISLCEIFTNILQDPSLHSTFLIIDALDEIVTGRSKLLDFIVQTISSSPRIKWVLSSRNWPDIESRLVRIGNMLRLTIDLTTEAISAAVGNYIKHKVRQLADKMKYDDKTRKALSDYLSLHANDTFLWVALVCRNLDDIPRRNVLAKLKEFPPGLDALYGRMMSQIGDSDDSELCKRILATIATVYQPITLIELVSLVEMPENVADDLESVHEIVCLCGSFLTIQRHTIYFVHQSAKDFLLNKAFSMLFPSGDKAVHYEIFSRSLQSMSRTLRRDIYSLGALDFPADQVGVPDPDPLAAARYSCIYWIDHLCSWHPSSLTHHEVGLQSGDSIDNFLRKKYLYWLEALSLCKSISKGIVSMGKLEAFTKETAVTPSLIKMVRDARRFIMYHKWAIEGSPLQAYASALMFSPTLSLTRILFQEELKGQEELKRLVIKPGMLGEWSNCLWTLQGHSFSVKSVAFSHDSTLLASASMDHTIKLWDVSSGECLLTLKGHSSCVNSAAFSYDSTLLASASNDCAVKIWDASSGACLSTLTGHWGIVKSVAFSHNSTWLASASTDDTVKVWDAIKGECLSTLEGHDDSVTSVTVSYDSTRLASASNDHTVKVWNASSGDCLLTILMPESSFANSVVFSHDSTLLASASTDHTIKIWDTSSGECMSTLKGHSHSVFSAAFSHDSTRLASASEDHLVKVWDASSGECLSTLEGHSDWVHSVSFSHDSTKLASVSNDRTVKVWDIGSIGHLATLEGHDSPVIALDLSPDLSRLTSVSVDGTVKVWNVTSGECLSTLEGHSGWVVLVANSHDSTRGASVLHNHVIYVWDANSGKRLPTLEDHSEWITSVTFSHNSTWLASASRDNTVKVWDASNGECLLTLEGHGHWVTSVAFSHHSIWLASGSWDKTIKVWDASSGECMLTLEGHSASVDQVAFSNDSTRLVSASQDTTVKIWESSSGECLLTLEGHSSNVKLVAFSHNSTRLASASKDSTIKVWDVGSGELLLTLELETKIRTISFGRSDSHLQTNIGVIDISAQLSSRPVVANSEPQSPQYRGLSLSADAMWLMHDTVKLLWLPWDYRPTFSVVLGNTIAFGGENGKVWLCTIQNSDS